MKAKRRLGRQAPTANALAGKHVALLFEKPSLRTRSTFEIAVRELGGDTLHLPPEFADGVREPLKDVARNLERWVLGARRSARSRRRRRRRWPRPRRACTSINALTDEEHPCQALADMLTLRERWGELPRADARLRRRRQQRRDVARPRGTDARHLGARGLAARLRAARARHRWATRWRRRDGAGVRRFTDPRDAVAGADAVYTDVWASMGQEAEAGARRLIFAPYQVNEALMAAGGAATRSSCTACRRTAAKKSPMP